MAPGVGGEGVLGGVDSLIIPMTFMSSVPGIGLKILLLLLAR